MISSPQPPPQPPVQLVDPRTGNATREFWRWLQLVNRVQIGQASELSLGQLGQVPADPQPSVAQVIARDLSRLVPPDPPAPPSQTSFKAHLIDVPPDPPAPAKQPAFLARMLDPPPDPPDYRQAIFRSMMFKAPGL